MPNEPTQERLKDLLHYDPDKDAVRPCRVREGSTSPRSRTGCRSVSTAHFGDRSRCRLMLVCFHGAGSGPQHQGRPAQQSGEALARRSG